MRKKILITGASSGFGKSMAHRFAKEGWNLVITGRREHMLIDLAKELAAKYGTDVLVKMQFGY